MISLRFIYYTASARFWQGKLLRAILRDLARLRQVNCTTGNIFTID
jgi:hypothetical protein